MQIWVTLHPIHLMNMFGILEKLVKFPVYQTYVMKLLKLFYISYVTMGHLASTPLAQSSYYNMLTYIVRNRIILRIVILFQRDAYLNV